MHGTKVIARCLIALLFAGAGLAGAAVSNGPSTRLVVTENAPLDAKLTRAVQSRLKGKHYRGIMVRVRNGVAMLAGEVDLFAYKSSATKKARKTKGVREVRDNIAVGGPVVADAVLQQRLLSGIEVDRVGYGQAFDAIGVSVHNGVALLAGHALGPAAKRSAIALAEFTPGVKGVVDRINIDPTSSIDDQIRIQTYRAIYGFPALQRYSIVPWKPIRISVQNSRVTLYGIVANKMDKQLAYTRAMQVPGVFQVTDELLVENSGSAVAR